MIKFGVLITSMLLILDGKAAHAEYYDHVMMSPITDSNVQKITQQIVTNLSLGGEKLTACILNTYFDGGANLDKNRIRLNCGGRVVLDYSDVPANMGLELTASLALKLLTDRGYQVKTCSTSDVFFLRSCILQKN